MAAPNIAPVFSRASDVQWIEGIVTANNTIDITSGTSYLVCTADSTNGGFLEGVIIKVNPANNGAATVVRFWLNNGSTTGTAANSCIVGEIAIPATTTTATGALPDFYWAANLALPAGYKVYATVGTAPGGSCEMSACARLGKY